VTIPQPPLLVITDRRQATRPLPEIFEAVFAAGCRWASLREKDLSAADQYTLARTLLPIAQRWGARLTLHGDAAMAKAAGVDGVHLAAGGNPAAARAYLGPEALVGFSIHSAAETARLEGADYAIAGPVFETESKPGYGPALGVAGIAAIARTTSVPIIAIGGIKSEAVLEILRTGAAGLALMGSVMRAADPGQKVKMLLATVAATRQ
jgi:thiamine-phosphate pyrophosphorylase